MRIGAIQALACAWVCVTHALYIPGRELLSVKPTLDPSQVGALDHHLANQILNRLPENYLQKKGKKSKIQNLPIVRIEFEQSINLGLSSACLVLDTSPQKGLLDEFGNLLASMEELLDIARKEQGCYALFNDGSVPWKISTMSDNTDKPASLCPPLEGTGPPTMVLGGFTMHRIVGVSPATDTEAKLSAVRLFKGAQVLDTCCGLGYTAIMAARKVGSSGKVVTVELDKASIEMCCANPHSRALFDGTLPLQVLQGNSCELIYHFKERVFDAIIHDPPARAICETDLYSESFYSLLKSRLKSSGKLFHYIGNPSSSESGRLYAGIASRLKAAGFKEVRYFPHAFGMVAVA